MLGCAKHGISETNSPGLSRRELDQQKTLKMWENSQKVQSAYGVSHDEFEASNRNQVNRRFPQPLDEHKGQKQPLHGKRCWVHTDCGWKFRCVQGICVGGFRPPQRGLCIKAQLSHLVCSNTGEECVSHEECVIP